MRTIDTIKMEENKTIAELEQNTLSNLVAGFELNNPKIEKELANTNMSVAEILKQGNNVSIDVARTAIETSNQVDNLLSMSKEKQLFAQYEMEKDLYTILQKKFGLDNSKEKFLKILEADAVADDYKEAIAA